MRCVQTASVDITRRTGAEAAKKSKSKGDRKSKSNKKNKRTSQRRCELRALMSKMERCAWERELEGELGDKAEDTPVSSKGDVRGIRWTRPAGKEKGKGV